MNFYTNPFYLSYTYPFHDSQPVQSYQEFCLSKDNCTYIRKLEAENLKLKKQVESLHQKIQNYEQVLQTDSTRSKIISKKKKQSQLFLCPYGRCQKNYKSSLALNLHIKIKHNGGSIREREAYAKLILQCQKFDKPIPEININFPPNFIEVNCIDIKNYRQKNEPKQIFLKKNSK